MARKLSFTKYERQVLPNFRERINKAESTEDVKKFFAYTAKELLKNLLEGKLKVEYGDIKFVPDRNPFYLISRRLLESNEFKSVWNDSDLPHVIYRLAESATGRYKRLERHSERSETKFRM